MPKIIFTSRYIKNPGKENAGKLLRYMGTRESVEKLPQGIDHAPVTVRQQRLIKDIVKSFPETKDYLEYKDLLKDSSKSNATQFIDSVIERNIDRLDGVKNLVSYMAERPGVEKIGAHGLFSQTDDKIDLPAVAKEINEHKGIIWTHVISLHRKDAERLGYNNADAWKNLIRKNVMEIAEAHNISISNFQWYAAFHNKDNHPHVHLLVYAKDGQQGWITKKSIEDMRSMFGNDIFRNEQYKLFEIETQQRNFIKEKINELLERYQYQFDLNPEIINLFSELSDQLKSCKGKKVYGYLPPKVKETVNKIVKEIAKDENIADIYSEWNKINREKLSLYHKKPTPDIPLENNIEFKSIKNSIIKAAENFEMQFNYQINNTENKRTDISDNNFSFNYILPLFINLLFMFNNSANRKEEKLDCQVDSKLRAEINEHKRAMGLKISGDQEMKMM